MDKRCLRYTCGRFHSFQCVRMKSIFNFPLHFFAVPLVWFQYRNCRWSFCGRLFWHIRPHVLTEDCVLSSETHRPASARWWLVVWFMMWEEQIAVGASKPTAAAWISKPNPTPGVRRRTWRIVLLDKHDVAVVALAARVSFPTVIISPSSGLAPGFRLSVAIGSVFYVRAVKEVNFHGVSLVLFCRSVHWLETWKSPPF